MREARRAIIAAVEFQQVDALVVVVDTTKVTGRCTVVMCPANLLTILSTEWTLDQIVRMDEALGGRIRERCGSYIVQIEKKDGRNYRLRKRGSNG